MLSIRRNSKEKRQFKQLPADQIAANPNQPRKHFDPQAIQELADSIRLFGILNPLTVRETEQGYAANVSEDDAAGEDNEYIRKVREFAATELGLL